jgi:hypothetical protein
LIAFPELIEIEIEFKLLIRLYSEYSVIKNSIAEWSGTLWSKLDAEFLLTRSNEFEKLRKKLIKEGFEDNSVRFTFEKLSNFIKSFRETIPLI